jgi:hypothetical protein
MLCVQFLFEEGQNPRADGSIREEALSLLEESIRNCKGDEEQEQKCRLQLIRNGILAAPDDVNFAALLRGPYELKPQILDTLPDNACFEQRFDWDTTIAFIKNPNILCKLQFLPVGEDSW